MPAHKNDTDFFAELSYAEQASSLNSQILNLKSQILAHQRKAIELNKEDSTGKFLTQLQNLISELKTN